MSLTGHPIRLVTLLMVVASSARAQVQVRGTVTDPVSGKPARGTRVEFAPGLMTWTGDSGQFALSVPPGTYRPTLSCPRRNAGALVGPGREVAIAEPARIDLELQGGAACLPALSTTEYGEFQGIFLNRPGAGWFRLCGDTTYQISARFSAAAWSGLNHLAREAATAGDLVLAIEVRGGLLGPGAFEGGEEYRLSIEQLKSGRFVRAADACR